MNQEHSLRHGCQYQGVFKRGIAAANDDDCLASGAIAFVDARLQYAPADKFDLTRNIEPSPTNAGRNYNGPGRELFAA